MRRRSQATTLTFRHTNRLHECLHGPSDRPHQSRGASSGDRFDRLASRPSTRVIRLVSYNDGHSPVALHVHRGRAHSSRRERPHSIAGHGVHVLPLSNPTRNPRPTRTKSTTSGSPEFCASGIPRTQTLRKGFACSDPRQRHGLKTRPRTQHMSCLPPGTELRSMSSLVSGGRRGFYMPDASMGLQTA